MVEVGECGREWWWVSLSEARGGGGPGSSLRRAEAAGAFVYLAVEIGVGGAASKGHGPCALHTCQLPPRIRDPSRDPVLRHVSGVSLPGCTLLPFTNQESFVQNGLFAQLFTLFFLIKSAYGYLLSDHEITEIRL